MLASKVKAAVHLSWETTHKAHAAAHVTCNFEHLAPVADMEWHGGEHQRRPCVVYILYMCYSLHLCSYRVHPRMEMEHAILCVGYITMNGFDRTIQLECWRGKAIGGKRA